MTVTSAMRQARPREGMYRGLLAVRGFRNDKLRQLAQHVDGNELRQSKRLAGTRPERAAGAFGWDL